MVINPTIRANNYKRKLVNLNLRLRILQTGHFQDHYTYFVSIISSKAHQNHTQLRQTTYERIEDWRKTNAELGIKLEHAFTDIKCKNIQHRTQRIPIHEPRPTSRTRMKPRARYTKNREPTNTKGDLTARPPLIKRHTVDGGEGNASKRVWDADSRKGSRVDPAEKDLKFPHRF